MTGQGSLFPSLPDTGATFSDDMVYRYTLWRRWGDGGRVCHFLMLNPSTADETSNDPTVERCQRRARAWGYDGLVVSNIFALRSTDPSALYGHPDPVGRDNDAWIRQSSTTCAITVCAWGAHGKHLRRSSEVAAMLSQSGVPLYALAWTADGEPRHPLYLPYALTPVRWSC